jgi:hypothetical protein
MSEEICFKRKEYVELINSVGDPVRCINYPYCENIYFREEDPPRYKCPKCGAVFEVVEYEEGLKYWWVDRGKPKKEGGILSDQNWT